MSAFITQDPTTRTTTLVWGPFRKPLSFEDVDLIARLMARTIGLGYATTRWESEQSVTIGAVISAPRTQPFTRGRESEPRHFA